jgi:hypothetical protein
VKTSCHSASSPSRVKDAPLLLGTAQLGRTPVRPFDRRRESPALFRPGDTIRFYEIDSAEYARIDAAAAAGDLYAGADADAA